MSNLHYVSSNPQKAANLAKYLGIPITHLHVDLDEIQSMSLVEIVKHKVRQAFDKVQKPVIVEDVSFEITSLGGLPGPFIKFFLQNMDYQAICNLVQKGQSREATVKSALGYFDGKNLQIFEGNMTGEIAPSPAGERGFGWDKFFIPLGYLNTRSQMNAQDYEKTYRIIRPLEQMRQFLLTIPSD